ncbi:hypothetical protein BCD64_28930 [Nostoc sp. MBR 210]|nr:hypothetical protein BCD64_28930 [Nostoc sp. MBR 210]
MLILFALILMFPALPMPSLRTVIKALPVTFKISVLIIIFPEFPEGTGYGVHTSPSKVIRAGVVGSKRQ